MKILKRAGISNFSINESDGVVTFIDVFGFKDEQLQGKIGTFVRLLKENNISYEEQQFRTVESRYVDKGKRKEVIRGIRGDGSGQQYGGTGLSETIERAIQRDAEFQGTTYEEYAGAQRGANVDTASYDRVMSIIDGIIEKSKKRGRPYSQIPIL